MADLVKVYTKEDIDKFSLEELEKTLKTLENVRRSQGPYVSQPNYAATMTSIKKALGKPSAPDYEIDLYVRQRIADIKNSNKPQNVKGAMQAVKNKVKGAIQAVKNTGQKLSGPAEQTVKPVYDNNKKTELTGGRFVPEQEQPKYNDTDRQMTMQTGGRVTKAPESVKQETGYKTNAELDKEVSLGHNVSGPLPKLSHKPEKTLQKGAGDNVNGGGSGEDGDNKSVRKSSQHSLWGNTDEVITDEIAREYYNNSKPVVQDYMSDPKYQTDPELAAQQAAIAAHNVIKGTPSTNMNGKTANQTLRLSRLTDALNNRVWTAPVTGGYATETYGTADISNPTGYKREAIETADTRQQQRLEQYEAAARDLDFNILKLQQQYNLMKAQGADTTQLNLWYQTAYQGMMQQFGQNLYHWQQQTDLKYNVQKAHTIRNLNHRNPEAASYLTAILGAGVVNNIIDADYNQAMADIMNDPSLTWQKKMAAVQLLTADMVQAPMSQITGALEGIMPGIKEVAKTASPFGGNKDASN